VVNLFLVNALVALGLGLGLDFLLHTTRFSDGWLSGLPLFATMAMVSAVAHSMREYFAGVKWGSKR